MAELVRYEVVGGEMHPSPDGDRAVMHGVYLAAAVDTERAQARARETVLTKALDGLYREIRSRFAQSEDGFKDMTADLRAVMAGREP